MLKLTRNQREQDSGRARSWEGKERKTRKLEEGSGDECGVCKTKECDTAMDANWTTSNCRTSMVQMVLYSGCTETAAPCSPYCTCIQYGSNAPTIRKKKSPNSSWWNRKQQDNINKKDKTTMLKLTRNEREQDRGRERSWEGKEGRKGSFRKEVVIC